MATPPYLCGPLRGGAKNYVAMALAVGGDEEKRRYGLGALAGEATRASRGVKGGVNALWAMLHDCPELRIWLSWGTAYRRLLTAAEQVDAGIIPR